MAGRKVDLMAAATVATKAEERVLQTAAVMAES